MNAEDRIDAMLDRALEMTFPASDPVTIYFPEVGHDRAGTPAQAPPSHAGENDVSIESDT